MSRKNRSKLKDESFGAAASPGSVPLDSALPPDSDVSVASLEERYKLLREASSALLPVDARSLEEMQLVALDRALSGLRRPSPSPAGFFKRYRPQEALFCLSRLSHVDGALPRLYRDREASERDLLIKARSALGRAISDYDFDAAIGEFTQFKWKILAFIAPDFFGQLESLASAVDELTAVFVSKGYLLLDKSPLVLSLYQIFPVVPEVRSRSRDLLIGLIEIRDALAALQRCIVGLTYSDESCLASGFTAMDEIMHDISYVKAELMEIKGRASGEVSAVFDGYLGHLDSVEFLFNDVYQPLLGLREEGAVLSEQQHELRRALGGLEWGLSRDKSACDKQMEGRINLMRVEPSCKYEP